MRFFLIFPVVFICFCLASSCGQQESVSDTAPAQSVAQLPVSAQSSSLSNTWPASAVHPSAASPPVSRQPTSPPATTSDASGTNAPFFAPPGQVAPVATRPEKPQEPAVPSLPASPPVQVAVAQPVTADATDFERTVQPFLKQYCLDCHGPDLQEGEFRVDTHLQNNFEKRDTVAKWREVVNVLNSHEMPPKDEPQPSQQEVAKVVNWMTGRLAEGERKRRDSTVVLRRMNRQEYTNTIRDLIGVEFDPGIFPADAAAGGFDNNGRALTLSPLHLELYFEAAQQILNQALVEGPRPPTLRWRFQPESGNSDSNRVTYDGQRLIVNGGKNRTEDGFVVMHHDNWDRKINVRDFRLPHEGEYIIRIRAAAKVPDRAAVVASARAAHQHRLEQRTKENPNGRRWFVEEMERGLKHFETDRMYDYGPPRLKLIKNFGGLPEVIDELDVDAPLNQPAIYERRSRLTTNKAGVTLQYDYSVPKEIENFWMQGHDSFARPELWVDWYEIEGPIYSTWPPESHQRILFPATSAGNERDYVREVLTQFMTRAYRRPVTAAEVSVKLKLYEQAKAEQLSLVQAIKRPLTAVLVSPHFLYLAEPAAGEGASERQLSDYELAARLSYFLWSSMPDDELFQLAKAGQLREPKVMAAQVDRLLRDPKSEQFVKNFTGQWLSLREVGANPPAADLYPRYDRHLERSIVSESEAFFAEILRHDLNVMNFIRSDFVTINERLARFYGIPGVKGDEFRRVTVPSGVNRGGIVTQASVLSITSNGTRTSPVKRGTWILKNILGTDPGLPVANAGEIAPKVPGIDKATVRQRLEIHRTLAQCARCHNKIDPLGFSLENFNAAGEWRDREGFGYKGRIGANDPEIDASAQLPDGTKFVGVDGLQNALTRQEDLFLTCLTEKLMTYALGRELGFADDAWVKAGVAHTKQNHFTMRSLIQYIVATDLFRQK